MYCKSCGAENPSSANYCVNDGTLLKSVPIKYREKERNSIFCSSCGSKTSKRSNYCQNCGANLISYSREKYVVPKLIVGKDTKTATEPFKLSGSYFQYIKKALIPALLAIFIVFLLSFSMMKSSEKLYNDLLNNQMKDYDINTLISNIESQTNTNLPKINKFFGISDIVMYSNLQNPEMSFAVNGVIDGEKGNAAANVQVKNGFVIYLLIPFIGLFAAGILSGRRNKRTNLISRLFDAVGIAILYSVFFTIFSFFAGFSYHVDLNEKLFNVTIDINTHYSFIKTLLMTFLLGFFFSSLGNLFSIRFRKTTGHLADWLPSGEAIHQAIAVPFRGILILFVVLTISITSKVSDLKDEFGAYLSGTPWSQLLDKSYTWIGTFSVQLGAYIWDLLHLSPLTFLLTAKSEKASVEYGIFSGFKTSVNTGDFDIQTLESMISSTDLEMYLKFAILLPIVLFLWAGFRISKRPHFFKNLLVFSFVYAIIMAGLTAFSDLGFSFSGKAMGEIAPNVSMELGFEPLGIFMRSLLSSFVFAYLGSWISKLRVNQ
jgi:hypothetical protein